MVEETPEGLIPEMKWSDRHVVIPVRPKLVERARTTAGPDVVAVDVIVQFTHLVRVQDVLDDEITLEVEEVSLFTRHCSALHCS